MDKIISGLYRAAHAAEDMRDGLTYRYWRTEALSRAADVAVAAANAAGKVSDRPGGWRLYVAADDLATFLHECWVMSGRDWSQRCQENDPDDPQSGFFLGPGAPETRAERCARGDRKCWSEHCR